MSGVTHASIDHQATRIVVLGGGPGGYEAALVARRLGADVTVVERQGLGGAAVLTDVVPSKTLIATADWMTIAERAAELGIRLPVDTAKAQHPAMRRHIVDLEAVNSRVMALAAAAIGLRIRRGGMWLVIGASCAVFWAYYMLMIAGESLADRLIVTPLVGMWWANAFLLATVLLLIVSRRRGQLVRNTWIDGVAR